MRSEQKKRRQQVRDHASQGSSEVVPPKSMAWPYFTRERDPERRKKPGQPRLPRPMTEFVALRNEVECLGQWDANRHFEEGRQRGKEPHAVRIDGNAAIGGKEHGNLRLRFNGSG